MEEKLNRGKQLLSDKIENQKDIILELSKIIVVGKKEITIENHKGIISFKDDEIKINTNLGVVSILGRKFEILYIASATITISGQFISVSFEE